MAGFRKRIERSKWMGFDPTKYGVPVRVKVLKCRQSWDRNFSLTSVLEKIHTRGNWERRRACPPVKIMFRIESRFTMKIWLLLLLKCQPWVTTIFIESNRYYGGSWWPGKLLHFLSLQEIRIFRELFSTYKYLSWSVCSWIKFHSRWKTLFFARIIVTHRS